MRHLDIFSDDVSDYRLQTNYKKSFLNKFGSKIDADDPFFFDDKGLVDGITGETIRGIELGCSTWKEITNSLIRYFHLDL